MKIIDLLKERVNLIGEHSSISPNAFFLTADCTEKERNDNRVYKDKVKQYNELTDRINEVYAKTRIKVEGYGDISLATAIDYYRSQYTEFGDKGDIASVLVAKDAVMHYASLARWYSDGVVTPAVPLAFPMPDEEEERKRRKFCQQINEFEATMFYELQTSILTAIATTEV